MCVAYRKGQFSCTICCCWLCAIAFAAVIHYYCCGLCRSCCRRFWFSPDYNVNRLYFVDQFNSGECALIVANIFISIFFPIKNIAISLYAIECYLFNNAKHQKILFIVYFWCSIFFLQFMHRLHEVVRLDTHSECQCIKISKKTTTYKWNLLFLFFE